MSLNLNRVTLAGHLTRDPELRQVSSDRAVAHFAMAINRHWRNQAGEKQEETTFVDIEAWGRTGELVGQYLKKGSPAYIEGRLKLDTWEDKEGQKRSRMKVVADNVQFLGGRSGGDGEGGETGEVPAAAAAAAAGTTSPAPARRPAAKTRVAVPPDGEDPPF